VDSAFAHLDAHNLAGADAMLRPILDSTVRATSVEQATALMLRGVIDFYRNRDSTAATDFRASLALSLALRGEWLARLDSSLGAIWQRERGRAMCGSAAREVAESTALSHDAQVVDEKPRILQGPIPRYPENLRRAHLGGRVLLAAIVDTAGRVEPGSIKIIDSPHEDFAWEARRYLEKAVFQPGRIGGRAVRVCVQVPIDFKVKRLR